MNKPASPCIEDGNGLERVKDAIVEGFMNGIQGDIECQNTYGIPCMIPQAKGLLTLGGHKSLNQCTTFPQYNCMFHRIIYFAKHVESSLTVKNCKTNSVSVVYELYDDSLVRCNHCLTTLAMPYLICFMQIMMNATTSLMIYLMDNKILSTTEYYLYDFAAIVSAVGGNMGLFLGFSCYSIGKSLLDPISISIFNIGKP